MFTVVGGSNPLPAMQQWEKDGVFIVVHVPDGQNDVYEVPMNFQPIGLVGSAPTAAMTTNAMTGVRRPFQGSLACITPLSNVSTINPEVMSTMTTTKVIFS